MGWSIFGAAIAGSIPFARDHRRHAAILGAFAAAFYIAIGSGYTVFFRYVLPLVPFVCLLAALRSVARLRGSPRGPARPSAWCWRR